MMHTCKNRVEILWITPRWLRSKRPCGRHQGGTRAAPERHQRGAHARNFNLFWGQFIAQRQRQRQRERPSGTALPGATMQVLDRKGRRRSRSPREADTGPGGGRAEGGGRMATCKCRDCGELFTGATHDQAVAAYERHTCRRERKAEPDDYDWKAERIPPAVRIALRVLLNHVEPGWDNVRTLVTAWIEGHLQPEDKT